MVYNNCALYMLLYKQCRGFYCCSKRVVNARSVFQEHHLVICGLGFEVRGRLTFVDEVESLYADFISQFRCFSVTMGC